MFHEMGHPFFVDGVLTKSTVYDEFKTNTYSLRPVKAVDGKSIWKGSCLKLLIDINHRCYPFL